jgi:hypothetical protein
MYCILHCTFTVYFLSLVCLKVRDSDILGWVRGQRKMSQVLGAFGYWISPCYGPFSLGSRFEAYEPSISLIFPFFRAGVNRGY